MKDIQSFCVLLEKACKIRRSYPKSAPLYSGIIDEIYSQCIENLKEEVELNLVENGVLSEDSYVYKKERDLNIFFCLYKDGLRQIKILPGIDKKEIEDFVDLINEVQNQEIPENLDSVGYLWMKNFPSISYLAIDGIGERGGEKGGEDLNEEIKKMFDKIKNPPKPLKEENSSYSMVFEQDLKIEKLKVQNLDGEKISFEELPIIYYLKDDEFLKIAKEVEDLKKEEDFLLSNFYKIILELVEKDEYKSNEDLFAVLKIFLKSFKDTKNYENFISLISILAKYFDENSLKNLILDLLDDEFIKDLGKNLKLEWGIDKFLRLISLEFPEFIIPFFENTSKKKEIQYTFKEILKEKPSLLTYFLKNEKGIAFSINFIEETHFIYFKEELKKAIEISNPSLKAKIVGKTGPFFSSLGIEWIKNLFFKSNQDLRYFILRHIFEYFDEKILIFLKELFYSHNFKKLSREEEEILLKIILKKAPDKINEFIMPLIPKRKIFLSKKEKEFKKFILNYISNFSKFGEKYGK